MWMTGAFFFFLAFSGHVLSLQWMGPLNYDDAIPACVGKNVSLPWDFQLDQHEEVQHVSWLVQVQGQEPELIAMYREGDFLPTDAFAERVQLLTNAGLVLDHVTTSDSGRYSVEVDVHDASKTYEKHEMALYLDVEDFFRVRQEPTAIYDNTTKSWHVQLKCGLFSSLEQPAGVVWVTPSGREVSSTSYKDGYLYLQLANPVEGGQYTCHLPPNTSSPACLPDDAPLARQQPTFTVEEVKARLTLLEAENLQMKTRMLRVEEGAGDKRVAFFARLPGHVYIGVGAGVKFTEVLTNQGEAYDPNTGHFTAPYNGTYFFAATSLDADGSTANLGNIDMQVGSKVLCRVISWRSPTYDTGSCHAVVQLREGEYVWMRSQHANYLQAVFTTFSGFLINAD